MSFSYIEVKVKVFDGYGSVVPRGHVELCVRIESSGSNDSYLYIVCVYRVCVTGIYDIHARFTLAEL